MAEYIDKEKFMQSMYHEAFETDSDLQRWDGGCWIRYKMLENVMAATPTADVQPVRRGKWFIKDVYPNCWIAACDQCGASYAVSVHVPFDEWTASDNRAYCGTCGAKMRDDKT